MGYAQQHLR
jgi:chromosome segregation ATPase